MPVDKHTICLLNDSFPPIIDGVANAVVNYAENIEKHHGHAVVVTPAVPGADDSGFPFPVVRYPSIDTRRLVGYVAGYPFSPETALRVREEKVELLHTHCPIASAILARSLREVVDAPLVLTYHTKYDIDIAKAVKSRLLQESAIRALVQNVNACDEVWVVSRGAGENLRSLGYEGAYTVMENGVDVPRGRVSAAAVAAATAGYDLPDGVPLFLFVGRLMWYKGLHIILDALRALREQGQDFRMVFIGAGGDEKEVRAGVETLRLSDRCFFTGSIADRETLRAWYSRADLFLFPSTFDTNGLVVREAAASGCPSVLIAGSCAAEGVTDGRNGFLIEENAVSLCAKLTALCADREAMRRVGENAMRELYLSWEDAVARANERYAVVLDRYRSGKCPKHERFSDEFFNTQGDLMEAMSRVAAAVRDGARISALLESTRERLRGFAGAVRIAAPTQLYALYRFYDILISQLMCLAAMEDYIAHGGKSRGSAIYSDTAGKKPFDALPEQCRFTLDAGDLSGRVQETRLCAANWTVQCDWRDVRPIPEEDDVFETVWRAYRETGNVD